MIYALCALGLLLAAVIVLQVQALRRRTIDWAPLTDAERRLRDEIARNRQETSDSATRGREELSKALLNGLEVTSVVQANQAKAVVTQLSTLQTAVELRLKAIQDDNAKQLDQMRHTVDEKLQGALEQRLGESFKQVSERLEQVHQGLGQMQTLAAGVGDLKKVLTNVKTRGTWGEVQLGALLEQVLSPEQYAANVATKGGNERVEFAVKLPGRGDNDADVLWLPIDAKFPMEDYQRLVEAAERSDPAAAEEAGRQLELRVKACAQDIHAKYISAPATTDFAILFLPTEGLFAEVLRRGGLSDAVQRQWRVVIAGPTTLWSILNSLQMGFRTLAIQQRSSEVWKLLEAVKTEWTKYGEILAKVQSKLDDASKQLGDAQKRTRVIDRKLRDVQTIPTDEARAVLRLDNGDEPPEA